MEDSEHDASLMLEALRWDQYEPESERVQTASAMRAALTAKEWDTSPLPAIDSAASGSYRLVRGVFNGVLWPVGSVRIFI